jgi:hypothetical protein
MADNMIERVARAYEPSLWRQIDSDLNARVRLTAANSARRASLDRARSAIAAMREPADEDFGGEFGTEPRAMFTRMIDAALKDSE